MKDFFSKCDQIRSFLWIWSHFTEEICNEKLHFFCNEKSQSFEQLYDLEGLHNGKFIWFKTSWKNKDFLWHSFERCILSIPNISTRGFNYWTTYGSFFVSFWAQYYSKAKAPTALLWRYIQWYITQCTFSHIFIWYLFPWKNIGWYIE